MEAKASGLSKSLGLIAVLVPVVVGGITIFKYFNPNEYVAEGEFNNSNNNENRFVECSQGDIMQSCNTSYVSDQYGDVLEYSPSQCSANMDISKSTHKCEMPKTVYVGNAHKCHVIALCKSKN